MSKFDTVDYTTCAAVPCYDIHLTIRNVRLFLANKKVRKEYSNKHKDGYTMVNQYLLYMISFLGFFVIDIIGIFVMERNMKDELYVYSALALMAIISVGMALDSIVKWRAIVNDDGFAYEKAHYRFRSVLSMDFMKSITKNIDILATGRQHVMVSKKMGAYLHECFPAWKKRKKNRNK